MNILEYASIFQSELDHQMLAKATSGWMEVNSDLLQYDGGDTVKIASIVMSGLADYSRAEGFPKGTINLTFEPHKLTQDRARTFTLDSMDVNETNFALSAANVMATFQNDYVIPEVDAYRYSKISALAEAAGRAKTGYTPKETSIWNSLCEDIAEVQDTIGEDKELIITMSIPTARILNNNEKFLKGYSMIDFAKGEIFTKVQSIDNNPIIKVSSSLFFTEYKFLTGAAGTEQEVGGFEKTATAKPINWIISAKSAPAAISKTEKVRIFDPDNNPNADAWKLDYRKYHDLWIPKNKLKGVLVNIGA